MFNPIPAPEYCHCAKRRSRLGSMRNSGVPARGVRALGSARLMTPIGVLEGFLVGFHLFFLRHFLDRLGPVSLSGLRLGSFVFGSVVHSQMGAKATYYSSFCATTRSARLFPFAHRLNLVSFASDTMPEELNFLPNINIFNCSHKYYF